MRFVATVGTNDEPFSVVAARVSVETCERVRIKLDKPVADHVKRNLQIHLEPPESAEVRLLRKSAS